MLKLYGWYASQDCLKLIEWLNSHNVPFEYYEMEDQPLQVGSLIGRVNGAQAWKVPTLEYDGRWRPAKAFDPEETRRDLIALGVPLE